MCVYLSLYMCMCVYIYIYVFAGARAAGERGVQQLAEEEGQPLRDGEPVEIPRQSEGTKGPYGKGPFGKGAKTTWIKASHPDFLCSPFAESPFGPFQGKVFTVVLIYILNYYIIQHRHIQTYT